MLDRSEIQINNSKILMTTTIICIIRFQHSRANWNDSLCLILDFRHINFNNLIILMFCCPTKQKNLEDIEIKVPSKHLERKDTIKSAWEIPVPDSKNIVYVKKLSEKEQIVDAELAALQHNSQIVLFNIEESKEVAISFNIKKTLIKIPKNTKIDVGDLYLQEHLYEVMAKRNKQNMKLLIMEHKNQLIEKKYYKYNGPFSLIMLIPQSVQYVSKITLKSPLYSKIKSPQSNLRPKTTNQAFASMISYESVQQDKKEHVEVFPFSLIKQVRLEAFDNIIVLPPFQGCNDILSMTTKAWIQHIILSLNSFTNLQKSTIILASGSKISQVLEILQEIIHQKIKSQPLEFACSMINFQLECLYIDLNLKYILLKKRTEEEGLLTLTLLAMNLFMIEFNNKSQFFYSVVLQKIKKLKFLQYIKLKLLFKQTNFSKKTLEKYLRENKWGNEDFLKDFIAKFHDMQRIQDTSGDSNIFKFHLMKQKKLDINEYLSNRLFCNYNDQQEIQLDPNEASRASSRVEAIIPSYQQYVQKQLRVESLKISSDRHSVRMVEYNEDDYDSRKQIVKSSFSNQGDENSPKKISKLRKNSNDY